MRGLNMIPHSLPTSLRMESADDVAADKESHETGGAKHTIYKRCATLETITCPQEQYTAIFGLYTFQDAQDSQTPSYH